MKVVGPVWVKVPWGKGEWASVVAALAVLLLVEACLCIAVVCFLKKAPNGRWRRAAKRCLLASALAFLVCAPAGLFALLQLAEGVPAAPSGDAPFVALGLAYVCFAVFLLVAGPREASVVVGCWRAAIWKTRAQVAECVEKLDREVGRRWWCNWAFPASMMAVGLGLVFIWLLRVAASIRAA